MIADRNRRQRRKPRRTGGSGFSCVASSLGGTITFQVFDVHRRVIATYVGTDDSGATETAPFMQTHILQQIQGSQQIGFIENEIPNIWRHLLASLNLLETRTPAVPAAQNGSETAATRVERFDAFGNLIWLKDERGYLTRHTYDSATGARVQTIRDVDTSQVGDAPAGWTTPAGGGLHLVTDYQHDARGRLIQELGPWHTIDINGNATPVRTARWTVYHDAAHEVWTAQGYATGSAPNYTYTLAGSVSITKSDHNGNVLEQIQAVRASTAGKLQPTDSFPQSSYVRWTTYQYTDCCRLSSTRVYHTIPAEGEGTAGAHYDRTDFGCDSTKQRNRSVSPGGTITFQVFDVHRHAIATYVGTDDSGATETDPFMQTHILQQIQGSQQIGFIENEILNTWRHLLASQNLLETRVPAVPASQKGGQNAGHARRAVRRLRQRGVGTGRPGNSSSLPMIAVLARAVLFTDPLTTPIMYESAKHSRKSKSMAAVKTYQGVVDNGIIRLDPEIRLRENLQVFVVVPETVDERPLQIHSPRLVHRNQLPDFAKEVS
jgi:hypothetical protein